jgi:hypothetical protein
MYGCDVTSRYAMTVRAHVCGTDFCRSDADLKTYLLSNSTHLNSPSCVKEDSLIFNRLEEAKYINICLANELTKQLTFQLIM